MVSCFGPLEAIKAVKCLDQERVIIRCFPGALNPTGYISNRQNRRPKAIRADSNLSSDSFAPCRAAVGSPLGSRPYPADKGSPLNVICDHKAYAGILHEAFASPSAVCQTSSHI